MGGRAAKTRTLGLVVLAVFLAAAAILASLAPRGAAVFAERTDPSRTYRVEFLTATNSQRWLHPSMDIPGTAHLVRVSDGRTLQVSRVVDFFGGGNADVIWLIGENGTVQVGRDITFRTVPPGLP